MSGHHKSGPGPADSPEKGPWQTFLAALGELRDGLLLLGGGIYVLGYLSWALFGLTHRMGFVPVVDAQYFIAGLIPALIVFAAFWIVRLLQRRRQKIENPVSPFRQKIADTLEHTAYVASGVLLLVIIFRKSLLRPAADGSYSDFSPWWASVLFVSVLVCAVCGMGATFLSGKPKDVSDRHFFLNYFSFSVVLMAFAMFGIYALLYFQDLPQAFGGPDPEPVQLDVNVSDISPSTLALMAPPQTGESNGVVRTGTLFLVLESGNFTFLQTNSDWSSANPIFKIKSEAVKSIFPVPPVGLLHSPTNALRQK